MRKEDENKIVAETFQEAWQYELAEIRMTPTWYIYLSLFSMAESVNQLEKLHKSLPDNVRLLRHHFIQLKKYWQYCFSDRSKERREAVLKKVLLAMWHGGENETAVEYYVSLIKKKGSHIPPKHFAKGEDGKGLSDKKFRVLSCAERCGYGDSHFIAVIFNTSVSLSLMLDAELAYMLVQLNFEIGNLTEELTYKILYQLPDYYLFKFSPGSLSGHLSLSFELRADQLVEQLEAHASFPPRDMIARSEFLASAANLLREHNISVEGDLIPILQYSK